MIAALSLAFVFGTKKGIMDEVYHWYHVMAFDEIPPGEG